MRSGHRAWAVGAVLLLMPAAGLLALPAGAVPMASGQDTRDTALVPQFNFTQVEVRPGGSGAVDVTVTNRYAQTVNSLRVELAFQVGGEWRHARPVAELEEPPRFDLSSRVPPPDLEPNESVTIHAPFTTTAATPEGVYLVSLIVRFSYLDASNLPRGAVFKSLGAVASESNTSLVDMTNYTATLEALGIDGVAPDTSVIVDSHSGEELYWQAVAAGVVVVAIGFGLAAYLGRRGGKRPPGRRKRS